MNARDNLYILDLDIDIESQLLAINNLLLRNRKADANLSEEIAKLEKSHRRLKGKKNDRLIDEWVDHLHHSVYQDAAHSMAAVGMLAPFIETIFYHFFKSYGARFCLEYAVNPDHERWKSLDAIQWDCHLHISKGHVQKNLVCGIFQLADAIGLAGKLPKGLEKTLSALYAYRNCMFHFGFEWPEKERERFAKQIKEKNWPKDWFSMATRDDKPWIHYLSEKFTIDCLKSVDQILDAMGELVGDKFHEDENETGGD